MIHLHFEIWNLIKVHWRCIRTLVSIVMKVLKSNQEDKINDKISGCPHRTNRWVTTVHSLYIYTIDYRIKAEKINRVYSLKNAEKTIKKVCTKIMEMAAHWGLYHVPVIPAGIRSFLWNLAESGRIILGRAPCQNYHSGDHLFQRNRAIPELGLEWTWNGLEWNLAECILHV